MANYYPWTKMDVMPRGSLEFWHQYEPAVSGHHIIFDYSGKNRHVFGNVSNAPSLLPNSLNGQPGWYFNNTRDPLDYTGNFTLKHLFIVAAYDDATFSDYNGLISGLSSGAADLLTGEAGTDRFFNFSHTQYRKSDVLFAANNQKAPVSNQAAVIEIINETGIVMDGIRIGQHRTFTARKWKGWFYEDAGFSTVLNELQRSLMYQYYAMRFWLWQKNADGLYIFPFPANKTRSLTRDREHYVSEAYSGDQKGLVRGTPKRAFELPFALRLQAEYEAAEAFHAQHYPLTPFIMRDYRFFPARDSKVRFASPLREQGSDVTFRFNYSFDVIEVD